MTHKRFILFAFVASLLAMPLERQSCSAQNAREVNLSTKISLLDVTGFAQDRFGYMWIATLGGLNRYNGYEYEQFIHNPTDSNSIQNDFVFSLLMDSHDRLWIGTGEGLCRFDFPSGKFLHFSDRPVSVLSIFEDSSGQLWTATSAGPGKVDTVSRRIIYPSDQSVQSNVNLFWEDSHHRLWIGLNGSKGLAFKKESSKWEYFSLPNARDVNCMYEDPQGLWWLGTNEGIVLFNSSKYSFSMPEKLFPEGCGISKTQITFIKEVEPLKLLIGTATDGVYFYDLISKKLTHNSPARYNPNHSSEMHTCYIDKQKNVWIGTYDKGVVLADNQADLFNADDQLNEGVSDKFVTRVIEDSNRNLWIGTRYNGLFRYSRDGHFTPVDLSALLPSTNEFLEVIFMDSRNRLWVAFETQLVVAEVAPDGKLRVIKRIDLGNVRTIKENVPAGVIWIGTWNGLYKISEGSSEFGFEKIASSNVTDICFTESGEMIYSVYGDGLFVVDKPGKAPRQLSVPPDKAYVSNNCITLMKDSQGRIWIGSYGNGLLCRTGGSFIRMTKEQGLPSNNVLCFQEDINGDIWASTSQGISRLKITSSGISCSNFFRNVQHSADQYHEKSGCRTYDGLIMFGGNHGLTFFNPMEISPNRMPPKINIEDLKISNKSIKPSPEGPVLKKMIYMTDRITLNHSQTTFSLDYAGIDFFSSNNLSYKYKLEGFDKQWNYVGTYRRASYSNIPRGKYAFIVYAINDEGIESVSPARLEIIVKPAPWFSWPAWMLYSLALMTLTFFVLRAFLNAKQNRQRAEMERNEKEREREVSKMKLAFFTNISHELRTPLTLIAGPLQELMSGSSSGENYKSLLSVIDRNTLKLSQLMNQLMDFAKIESGVLSLKVQYTDIIPFLKERYDSFSYLASRKKIKLDFSPHAKSMMLWADTDKVEKIINNLLSNAIKHTPENGDVEMVTRVIDKDTAVRQYDSGLLADSDSFLEVSVIDSGPGVPADKLSELFVRYRQIETTAGPRPDYSGNGIGLNYTKTLVEKHNGLISARIRDVGGMDFSFILPLSDVYSDNEKIVVNSEDYPDELKNEGNDSVSLFKDDVEISESILIVEDNVELKDFLVYLFSDSYKVTGVVDSREGWKILNEESPDLLLSDVIMPGLSGYELCSRVKNSPELGHIPVVLLTAKTTMDEQIEGLENGADAYICKPFNVSYLKLTVKNLLNTKAVIRSYYSFPKSDGAQMSKMKMNDNDRMFMDKLTAFLEQRMSDSELDIDTLVRELGFSRTVFYRKIKGLTGLSPNDFIKNYRFKCAGELILDGSMSLIDVAEHIGYNSYSYFSRSFKKHFGLSPKEYELNARKSKSADAE